MKPDCEDALREIERFLDGEMGAPEHAKLDAHLHGCPPCMERTEFQRHVRFLIADRCGCDEVPAELRQRVLSFIERPPPTGPAVDA